LATSVTHMQQTITAKELSDESERLRIGVALEEVLLNSAYHGNLELSFCL